MFSLWRWPKVARGNSLVTGRLMRITERTLQIHQNIVGVASLKELAGIIIVNGREPEEETLQKAEAENIPVLGTELPAFDIIGKLYRLIGEC